MNSNKKKQQVEVLKGVLKDLDVLSERLRRGAVTPRTTWQSLDEVYELLQDLSIDLTREQL